MTAVVIASDVQKEELLAQGLTDGFTVHWMSEPAAVKGVECYIDLLFINTIERIASLNALQPATIIINDVIAASSSLPADFIRINGWNGFLKRSIVEAAGNNSHAKSIAETVFAHFSKTTEWVPDTAGMISARVVAMIINEAYFTLEEDVSTKEEIDTAMKLGTNYPLGPFEWAQQIGLKNVYELLLSLSITNVRYQPSALLKKEVFT